MAYNWRKGHDHLKGLSFFTDLSGGFKGEQVGVTAPSFTKDQRKLGLLPPFLVRITPLVATLEHSFLTVSIRMWYKRANHDVI